MKAETVVHEATAPPNVYARMPENGQRIDGSPAEETREGATGNPGWPMLLC